MMRFFLMITLCAALIAAAAPPALANLKYYPDPTYKRLNDDDPQAMDEMITLAKQGDVRAQFIIADMYEKGKGGLEKDLKEAHRWFEEAGMHGYNFAFIRLAAMAKDEKKPAEAWKWYTLAIDGFDYGKEQDYVIKARHDLVEKEKLSDSDIRDARKSLSAWKDSRDDRLREEKETARKQQEQEEKAAKDKIAVTDHDKKPPQQEKKHEQN